MVHVENELESRGLVVGVADLSLDTINDQYAVRLLVNASLAENFDNHFEKSGYGITVRSDPADAGSGITMINLFVYACPQGVEISGPYYHPQPRN